MKRLIAIIGISALFFFSCQKEISDNDKREAGINQTKTVCGTTEVMARMDPEMKAQLMSSNYQNEAIVPHIVIYLDFDGAIIFPGLGTHDRSPLVSGIRTCPPAPLTQEQRLEIIEHVSDYYSPFNITITEDFAVFNSTLPGLRHLCVISTLPGVIGLSPGTVGVAPFNCNRIFNSPSFVFAQNYENYPKFLGAVIAHEVGHTLGLDHQSLFDESCQFLNEYHSSFGTGTLGFSPIMGFPSVTPTMYNWFTQTCEDPPCRPTGQDDFSVISSSVELRADDFPDMPSGNNTIINGPIHGILEKQNDVDFIRINFQSPGTVTITSENIDLKVSLVTIGGHVLSEYNDPENTHVTISQAAGVRFLKVEGASNVNMSSQFMTGKYKIVF